jgi:DUF1009 family protein
MLCDSRILPDIRSMASLTTSPRTIGIIAGSGVYPEVFVAAARRKVPGIRLVMCGFTGETRPEMEQQVDATEWARVGQLSKPIKFFRREGATEVVMIGQISPKNLFDLRTDLRALMMLARLKTRNAETIFGAIADEMGKDGISVLPATSFLEDHLPATGPVCGPTFNKRQLADAEFGFRIAKQTSALDIELGRGKDVMLVKVSKPNQDFRFDVPVVGPQTIETCAAAGVGSIAIEAGKTLLLERERVAELCDKHRIGVHAVS